MRKQVLLLVLLSMTGLAGLSALGPQDLVQVEIANGTGRNLVRLFWSESRSSRWGADLLGETSLAPGKSIHLLLHFRTEEFRCDFLGLDEYGQVFLMAGHAFLEEDRNHLVTLQANDRKGHFPVPGSCRLYVSNASTGSIVLLFIGTDDGTEWGFDLLGDSRELPGGASQTFGIPCGGAGAWYEVYAVSLDGRVCRKRFLVSADKEELFMDILPTDLR